MKRVKFQDELRGATWLITAIALIYFGGYVVAWFLIGCPTTP